MEKPKPIEWEDMDCNIVSCGGDMCSATGHTAGVHVALLKLCFVCLLVYDMHANIQWCWKTAECKHGDVRQTAS